MMIAPPNPPDKFDLLRQKAEALITRRPDGAPQEPADMLELINELKVHQAELEIQNEELKRAQQELTDLYRDFEDLYEFAPNGYLSLNPKGVITRINLAGVMLLNDSRKGVLRTGFTQYVDSVWQDRYLAALRTAGRTGEKQGLELHLESPKDVPLWVWAEIVADRTYDGEVIQWRISLVDISAKKVAESAMQASESKYKLLFDEMVSGATLLEIVDWDKEGRPIDVRVLEVNAAFEHLTGISREEAVGKCIRELWPNTEAFWFEQFFQAMRSRRPTQVEGYHQEIGKHFMMSAFMVDINRIGTTFIDISAHKKIEEALDKARRDLEVRVIDRTAELRRANRDLKAEIVSRKQAQLNLQEKSEELLTHASELADTNITLKVLLKEREEERLKLEEKVVCNLNELTRPHLAKLEAGKLTQRQRAMLDAVNKSLDDITSPLSRRFVIDGSVLTPAETRVASLIRQGSATKEIAELMGIATSTVDFHRLNIRRKLKLTNKQVNLQSHLRSLQ